MTSLEAAALPQERRLAGPRRGVAIGTVLAAMTLAVLDAGMTNVALPSLAAAFHVAPARAILVVTAYQAGLLMALLSFGALGERYGHRRVFTLSVAAFASASGAAALAPGFTWLVAARFVEGLGGAGILALGVALMRFSVPSDQLGRAIGWNALNVALASAAGPMVGAAVLAVAGWRGLFVATLPIALAALAGSRALPATPRDSSPFDIAGAALTALASGLLILTASAAGASPLACAVALGAGLGALLILFCCEAPKPRPLFPVDLLRSPSFRLSVIASVCCFAAQSAALVTLPFLLHTRLQETPTAMGVYIAIWPLSVAIAALAAGRLSDRWSTAGLCAVGGAALSAGLAGAAVLTDALRPTSLIPWLVLAGAGFGLFQSPNNRNLLLAVPAGRSGAAGGMQGTARVTGQLLGALAVADFLQLAPPGRALPWSLGLGAVLALTAGGVSLLRIRS